VRARTHRAFLHLSMPRVSRLCVGARCALPHPYHSQIAAARAFLSAARCFVCKSSGVIVAFHACLMPALTRAARVPDLHEALRQMPKYCHDERVLLESLLAGRAHQAAVLSMPHVKVPRRIAHSVLRRQLLLLLRVPPLPASLSSPPASASASGRAPVQDARDNRLLVARIPGVPRLLCFPRELCPAPQR